MAQKQISIEGLGSVVIVKRRGTRSMRLSIDHSNQPRLSMPYYMPYQLGIEFIKSKKEWLITNQRPTPKYTNGSLIGKTQRLIISEGGEFKIRNKRDELLVTVPAGQMAIKFKKEIDTAIEISLRKQSEQLLLPRLEELANSHRYQYKSARIRKLRSRWGSCNSKKEITLSLYLIQLPWELIDFVLVHELIHTVHMNHKQPFWQQMGSHFDDIKALRSKMRTYRPSLL